MRIRQLVEFMVYSDVATVDEVTDFFGMQPDKAQPRGSITGVVPRNNRWLLVCDSPGLTIDEQAADVLSRVRTITDRLIDARRDLLGDSGGCRLRLVRYFSDVAGDEEVLSDPDEPLQKLTGQHQLLGWNLDVESLALLVRVGADLDADEYG